MWHRISTVQNDIVFPKKTTRNLLFFKFTGIPHHEALDPNGNVLKVNNTYYEGKDVFLRKIESMKRM